MKYVFGFLVGTAVISAVTMPFRTKAFTKAYLAKKAELNK